MVKPTMETSMISAGDFPWILPGGVPCPCRAAPSAPPCSTSLQPPTVLLGLEPEEPGRSEETWGMDGGTIPMDPSDPRASLGSDWAMLVSKGIPRSWSTKILKSPKILGSIIPLQSSTNRGFEHRSCGNFIITIVMAMVINNMVITMVITRYNYPYGSHPTFWKEVGLGYDDQRVS